MFGVNNFVNLRELVLVHDRNPESMRTVPRVCAAGRDSVPRNPLHPRIVPKNTFVRKIGPVQKNGSKSHVWEGAWGVVWAPENFPVFSIFQPPQHRPHVELREPGSELWNPGFPFFIGGRDSASRAGIWDYGIRRLGAGIRSLGSGVAGFGFPTPRSI